MTQITKLSLKVGIILITLGVGLYLYTSRASVTALIPAFIGAPIVICGLLAINEKKRKLFAHIALVFALIGALGGIGRAIPKIIGGEINLPSVGTMIMGILCVFYLVACIKSFKDARKNS
ncbi:MAG: hypothetical protein CMO54_09400 [Verrucomicrobiales bacterium]|nr:hypothetical protein [Verrucomicrobiales bacterium]|tara:strand:- start:141 stop:500 length:360 start_codon:yes stop_codon:yes gene_type:complete